MTWAITMKEWVEWVTEQGMMMISMDGIMILIVMIVTEADLVTDMGVLSTDFNIFILVLGQCILYSLKKSLMQHNGNSSAVY